MKKLNYTLGFLLLCTMMFTSCNDDTVPPGYYVKGDLEKVEAGADLAIKQATIAQLGIPFDNYAEYNGPWVNYEGLPRYVVVPDSSGGIYVAWEDAPGINGVYITHIIPSGSGYKMAGHFKVPGLRRLGGFARDAESGQFYVITCQRKGIEVNEPNPYVYGFRLASITSQGQLDYLVNFPIKEDGDPLFAGTGRLAYLDGVLMYHFAVRSGGHQAGVFRVLHAENGESARQGGTAHVYSQRLISDGEAFVEVVLGGGRTGVTLWRSVWSNDERIIKKPRRNIAFAGGAKLGAILATENGYMLSFITRDYRNGVDLPDGNRDGTPSRQAVVVHITKNLNDYYYGNLLDSNSYDIVVVDTELGNHNTSSFEIDVTQANLNFHTRNHGLVWLSNFDNEEQAKRTKLVDIGSGRYMALWEHWPNENNAFIDTWGIIIDEYGNTLKEAAPVADVKLTPNAEAFELGGKAAWMAGENGKMVIYTVDENYILTRHEFN